MTDLADVALRVRSEEIDTANQRMTAMVANSARVDVAAVKVARASDEMAAGLGRANTASGQLAAQTAQLSGNAGRTTSAMAEMAAAIRQAEQAEMAAYRASIQAAGGLKTVDAALDRTATSAQAAAYGFERVYEEAQTNFATAYVAQMNAVTSAHSRAGRQIGLTAAESLNLSRQMADVGVSLAMGMNPLMVMIQQGPQISDTFSQASARGVGFSAALRGMVAAAGPLLPILAGVAAAAGVLAAGVGIAANQIGKGAESAEDLQRRLGLTDAEMAKMGNTAVTMGDVVAGSAKYAGDKIMEAFGPALRWAQEAFQKAIDWIARTTVAGVKVIGGSFVGAFNAVRATWSLLPGAMGDVVAITVNAVLDGVEVMVNRAIGAINTVVGLANTAAETVGLSWRLPTISEVELSGFKLSVTGAFTEAGKAARDGFTKGMGSFGSGVDGFLGGLGDAILGANRDRNNAKAAELIASRRKTADATRDAAKATDEFAKSLDAFNDMLADAERLANRYADAIDRITARTPTATDLSNAETAMLATLQADETARAADEMARLDQEAQRAAQGISQAFGRVGDAIGGVTTAMTRYGSVQADVAARSSDALARYWKLVADNRPLEEQSRAQADYYATVKAGAQETAFAQVRAYGDMASAGQSFFKKGSDGWRIMQIAMIGFRTVEQLMTLQAIALKGVDVSTTVAAEGIKATASGIAAYAKTLASLPFPFNLAAGATVLAALASVGVALSGGGGGSSGPTVSERRQSTQGTGTVLGDASAKSESIANSLALVAENTNKDLEFSSDMLRALRSIDDQIGTVAAAVARSLGVGGALDTSKLGLGTSGTAPSLSNLGFSSSTTKSLVDQGISFVGQTIGAIISGGLDAATYNTIKSTSKKTAFGITYSSSTKTKTSTSDLEDGLQQELTRLVGSLRDGVLSAAAVLGVTGAQATLDAFALNLGKISLKGLSGDEIEQAIAAVFGAAADDMATSVIPALTELQKVGEGAFETLIRVARQYEVVDTSLKSIGMTFGATGVASLAARERLVDLMGGLDEFADRTAFFADEFLTEAQQLTPVISAVRTEMNRLGLAGVSTHEQFATVVQGLDLSTASGAELYAALMAVAPAFDKVADAALKAAEDVADAQARVDALLLEAADRATEAMIAGLEAVRAAAQEQATAAAAAEQEALGGVNAARDDLRAAYDAERASLLATTEAVTAARAALNDAYAREREALLAVADTVTEASDKLRGAWEAQRATLISAYETQREAVVAAYEAQREALLAGMADVEGARDALTGAYERERDALLAVAEGIVTAQNVLRSAYDAQRQALVSAYEEQRQAILSGVRSVEDARGVLRSSYDRERTALLAFAEGVTTAQDALRSAFERESDALRAASEGVTTARGTLTTAYEREAGALQQTADKFTGFADALGKFRSELAAGDSAVLGPIETLQRRQAAFRAMAAGGGEAALNGGLETTGRAYIDAALNGARTATEYQRAVAEVMRATSVAEAQARQQADVPTQQLAALKASVAGLLDLDEGVKSVAQAISELRVAQAAEVTAQAQLQQLRSTVGALIDLNDGVQTVAQAIASLRAAEQANATAQAQLQQLDAAVSGLLNLNEGVLTVAQAVAALRAAQATDATAQAQLAALDRNHAAELAALDASVAGLINVDQSVKSVADAITELRAAQAADATAQAQLAELRASVGGLINIDDSVITVAQAIAGLATAQQSAAATQAQIDTLDANHTAQLALLDANHTAELAALDAQVGALIDINTSVLSVEAAIAALGVAQGNNAAAQAQLQILDQSVAGLLAANDNILTVAQGITNLQSAQQAEAAAQAQLTALEASVAGILDLNTGVMSVGAALGALATANTEYATAQAANAAAQLVLGQATLAAQQAQAAYDDVQDAREAAANALALTTAQSALTTAQAALAAFSPASAPIPGTPSAPAAANGNGMAEMAAELRALREEVAQLRQLTSEGNLDQAAIRQSNERVAKSTSGSEDLWKRVTRGGDALLTEVA